ncbi:hypothetical protein GRI97_11950 [Altererythrobacter xixiisoli]|uniref:Uncharacterized protein n=1 Tax=Croceibacterium xixiisoli TaxID=1476466 RepID=A0A6I4TZA6_9SPHN|nr:hypothetical protein [Croceibacterium xixiisoli]MXO99703.1 hypothetical protein [Croceibacterium xixiisoli]
MTNTATGADQALQRRLQVEGLLSQYPAISAEETDQLRIYFRKEASALDIGNIASNEAAQRGYQQFRADHVDKIGLRDIGIAIGLLALVAAAIAVIIVLTK